MTRRFDHDPSSGLYLPRTRRMEVHAPSLCEGLLAHHGLLMGGAPTVAEAIAIYNAGYTWWEFDDSSAATTYSDINSANPLTLRTGSTSSNEASAPNTWRNKSATFPTTSSDGAYIPRSNTAFDYGSTDWYWCFWLRVGLHTDGLARVIMGRYGDAATNFGYGLNCTNGVSNSQLTFHTYKSDHSGFGTAVTSGNIASATNTMVTIVHDNTAGKKRIYLNTTKTEIAYTSGVYSGGTANFALGLGFKSDTTDWDTTRHQDMTMDDMLTGPLALTDAQVAYLYNSGVGKSAAQFKTDAGH